MESGHAWPEKMETGSEEKSLPVSNISDPIVVFGNVSTISVGNILGYI